MKAAAARLDITPSNALDQGAGARAAQVSVSSPPQEPLEANLLALWACDDDDPVLLVTLDLLYPGPAVRDAVESAASPLPPERIVVAASHTHRAPMTDAGKPLLGAADDAYLAWLAEKLSHAVREVLNVTRMQDARLAVGAAEASHSVNRRRRLRLFVGFPPRRNVVERMPNPGGPVDENVIVATIDDGSGKPLARLWNYACHPVAHPDPSSYSSHYIHEVRTRMRDITGDDRLPVLFFQGFSGDTRPTASIGVRGWRSWPRRLLSGPQFRDVMRRKRYRDWSRSLADRVLAAVVAGRAVDAREFASRRLTRPGREFADGTRGDVSFQAIRFSDDFMLVGVSGEPVCEYAPFVRDLTGAQHTICAGCIDDVFGYIPTAQMVAEGGYESAGFCHEFGLRSIAADVEENTRSAFRALLARQP